MRVIYLYLKEVLDFSVSFLISAGRAARARSSLIGAPLTGFMIALFASFFSMIVFLGSVFFAGRERSTLIPAVEGFATLGTSTTTAGPCAVCCPLISLLGGSSQGDMHFPAQSRKWSPLQTPAQSGAAQPPQTPIQSRYWPE